MRKMGHGGQKDLLSQAPGGRQLCAVFLKKAREGRGGGEHFPAAPGTMLCSDMKRPPWPTREGSVDNRAPRGDGR